MSERLKFKHKFTGKKVPNSFRKHRKICPKNGIQSGSWIGLSFRLNFSFLAGYL